MRIHAVLIRLLVIQILTIQFATASNTELETSVSVPATTTPAPPPGPGPNPIDELITQLQALNKGVANLNTTIRDDAQLIADRWNQSNVEFKQATEMVDDRLAPLNLLKLGFFIGLPIAVFNAVALPVMYCMMNRAVRYQKIINESV